MKKSKFFYNLGNLLIIFSLLGFTYTLYPVITAYLFPPKPPEKTEKINMRFFLSIPKIHAYSEVVENVDPWNEATYREALKKGVAHAKGTYMPGENKTIFLFAHSSGAPWELTHINTIFLRLGSLEKNDTISIDYKGKRFIYKVIEKREVYPQETDYLKKLDKNVLIIQTCTPMGTSLKRLLVFATPTK